MRDGILNTSFATFKNDPTLDCCVNSAHAWSYGGLVMANMFAYRSPDPKVLHKADDSAGPMNPFR
jgi:hypothetical protein